jgi:hypothetical protein
MSRLVAPLALLLVVAGCGLGPEVSAPTATPASSATPSPSLDASLFRPLPQGLAGLPPGGGPSAVITPQTQRGLPVDPSLGHAFELPHCGLLSPLDLDGSLWDPVGGHDGRGGALTEQQTGELINGTRVRLFLVAPDTALLVTPANAFVLLTRHAGAREYGLCD